MTQAAQAIPKLPKPFLGSIELRAVEYEPFRVEIELTANPAPGTPPERLLVHVCAHELHAKALAFLLPPVLDTAYGWLRHVESFDPSVADLEDVAEHGIGPDIKALKHAWLYGRLMATAVARKTLERLGHAARGATPARFPAERRPPAQGQGGPPAPEGSMPTDVASSERPVAVGVAVSLSHGHGHAGTNGVKGPTA